MEHPTKAAMPCPPQSAPIPSTADGDAGLWDAPVSVLRGVGEKKCALLHKLGIDTLGDMLLAFPRAYQNRGDIRTIAAAQEAAKIAMQEKRTATEPFSILATVAAEPRVHAVRRGLVLVKVRVFDETGSAELTYFHMEYVKNVLHTGGVFRFFGRFSYAYNRLISANPLFEPYTESVPLPPLTPVYALTAGLRQVEMVRFSAETLSRLEGAMPEILPPFVGREAALPDRRFMFCTLHRPPSLEALETARRRLVFEQLYLQFLCMAKAGEKRRGNPHPLSLSADALSPFLAALPFALTEGQSACIAEILADMRSPRQMNRIVVGDVGSGKTVTAAAAMYLAVRDGGRAVLLAPTEILAEQHYRTLSAWFGACGISCALLTGSTKKATRNRLLAALAADEDAETAPDILIGTHALLAETVRIPRLTLAVVDEQHRFGVLQRAAILEKGTDAHGDGCHCLFLSATPIPRTLFLAAYGSLDVSRIDTLPRGRLPVQSFLVGSTYHTRLLAFIRKQVEAGHAAYVVCPAIAENDETADTRADPESLESFTLYSLPSPAQAETAGSGTQLSLPDEDGGQTDTALPLQRVVAYAEKLAGELPELRVGCLHGRMKPAEKDAVMHAFAGGELDVLVSTTVIEVGVDVPGATLMIVENAERFGLSQLHQLRGRVGRGDAQSYFVMVSDTRNEDSLARLRVLRDTRDGFAIAEADLAMRGAGEFLGGVRQHGQGILPLAAACRDTSLISLAAGLAVRTIADDETLSRYPLLRERVDALLTGAVHVLQ